MGSFQPISQLLAEKRHMPRSHRLGVEQISDSSSGHELHDQIVAAKRRSEVENRRHVGMRQLSECQCLHLETTPISRAREQPHAQTFTATTRRALQSHAR